MPVEKSPAVQEWRNALQWVVTKYDHLKETRRYFHLKLFSVLFVVNTVCYWVAMSTAFPEFTFGERWLHYFKMQLPVGIFAALFELISVYITLFLMRHALRAATTRKYLGHLFLDVSADFVIGFAAAIWVIFSFTFSSWLVAYTTRVATGQPIIQQRQVAAQPSMQQKKRKPKMTWEKWQTLSEEKQQAWIQRRKEIKKRRLAKLRGTARDLAGKRDYAVHVFVNSLQYPYKNWRNFYFGAVLGATELLPSLFHFFFGFRALFKLLVQYFRRRPGVTT